MLDKRAILIVAALAVPVIALGVMTQHTPKNNGNTPAAAAAWHPPATLAENIGRVKTRIGQLEKMTPEQFQEERKTHPNMAPTLAAALERNQNRLVQLQHMTEDQWKAERQPKPAANNANQQTIEQRITELEMKKRMEEQQAKTPPSRNERALSPSAAAH